MLRPVIDGEYWSGPDTITVEPQQSKNYELTYRPLTMTQEGKKHMVRNTIDLRRPWTRAFFGPLHGPLVLVCGLKILVT